VKGLEGTWKPVTRLVAVAACVGVGVAGVPGPPAGARLRRCVAEFAQAKHRHIAIENAMVLPLARARLTPRDWSVLGRGLAARRFAAVAR